MVYVCVGSSGFLCLCAEARGQYLMLSSIALSLVSETGFLSELGAHQAMLVGERALGICLSPSLSTIGDYRCHHAQLLCRLWRSESRFCSIYIKLPTEPMPSPIFLNKSQNHYLLCAGLDNIHA